MPDTTPILQLPYILPAQAQKHVTHNEAIRVLDVIVQLAVRARNLSAPPPAPAQGDRYIVASAATDDWAGHAGDIALYENGAWQFFTPMTGWTAWITSEQVLANFTGSAWVSQADGPFNVGQLGISATPDTTNRLSVSADATLLNHAGAGHQLKVNKSDPADTASLLFQTGFSGRAEMGTMGNDDFAIKVSADGSAFVTGLSIEAGSGRVTLPAAARLGGQASDPVAPPDGTIWLNSTTGEVKLRSAGATVVLASGALGLPDGDKGDVTVTAGGTVWEIDTGAVSNSKLAPMPSATFKARLSAGVGAPEDISAADVAALLPAFSTTANGVVPASGGGASNFLRADGSWAAPVAGGAAFLGLAAVRGHRSLLGSAGWNFAAANESYIGSTPWMDVTTQNGVTVTKIASGVGDDGLPFVDYTAAGEASASGVIQLYLSSMSRAAFAAGQTWTVSILAQIIAGTVPAATGTGVRLEINGETTAGIFLQNISSVSHRPTAETVVAHTGTLTAAGIQQTRCGVALRTDAGVSVNYTIRIKALQFELGTARTNGRLRELSPADVHSVIADGGVLPLGALGLTGALAAAGWQRLPSGLIFQWGRTASTGSSVAITFPIAFPNACFQGFATPFYNTSFAGTGVLGAYFQATSAAGATITNDQSGSVSATAVQWLAIGN